MKFAAAIVHTTFLSPLGRITLAASPQGLAGLWFEGQRHWPAQLATPEQAAAMVSVAPLWPACTDHAVLQAAMAQLGEYFEGQRQRFDLTLDLGSGSAFQQRVWRALLDIPAGTTLSYGAVSRHIGQPTAVRAVAAAIGRNPLSIVVPCHRVVGQTGHLTGYAGGLPRKSALLALEGAVR